MTSQNKYMINKLACYQECTLRASWTDGQRDKILYASWASKDAGNTERESILYRRMDHTSQESREHCTNIISYTGNYITKETLNKYKSQLKRECLIECK